MPAGMASLHTIAYRQPFSLVLVVDTPVFHG
jgi:hypothetical protein